MASWIKCDNGHRGGTRRKAAREISRKGKLEACQRCGGNRHYFVSQHYPYESVTAEYEVLKVYTPFSAMRAEREGWDPMILLMRDRRSKRRVIWPYYWTKNRLGKWANGQFPSLLSVGQLKGAIKKFERRS